VHVSAVSTPAGARKTVGSMCEIYQRRMADDKDAGRSYGRPSWAHSRSR
jgi:hypothetical protein